jgi:malate dehydrogenase (oxaloacetate-decarboxylating)
LDTKSKEEIIRTIEILSPNFAAFNLEDVKAPKSLEIMEELRKKDLIVFHDDEQGVAVVVLAALINALKVVAKKIENVKICIGGAGAAGYGIFKLLDYAGIKNLVVFDAKGIIFSSREDDNKYIQEIAANTNPDNLKGEKKEALSGSDVFIGVTGVGNLLDKEDVALMKEKPIIFAISNPVPEIFPIEIKKSAKKFIFASGRSDFPNQINNIIVFPGIFRGLIDFRKKMDLALELKIAKRLAALVKKPGFENIIPNPFDKRLIKTIVSCIKNYRQNEN